MNDSNNDRIHGEHILSKTVLHKRRRAKYLELEEQNVTLQKKLQLLEQEIKSTPAPKSNPYFREDRRVEKKKEIVAEKKESANNNIAMLSEYISKNSKNAVVKDDPQTVRESFDLADRVKLLEQDLFRVQAQATPNTLVAGIGASLDSGGGAVWLWDLEDVNIGTPVNGQYPSINDGQTLIYDLATNQWIPGTPGGGNNFDGDITAEFLEFDGIQAAQAIRVTGAANKKFEIEVGQEKETAVIVATFQPQKLTLPGGGELACTTVTASGGTFNGTTNFNEANVSVLAGARQGLVYKLQAGTGLTFEGSVHSHIGGTVGNEYHTNVGTLGVGPTVVQTTGEQTLTGAKKFTADLKVGTALQDRVTLGTDGSGKFKGPISLYSPNGTEYKITVTDAGALEVTAA